MKLSRRDFLKGLAAGMAVATIPAAIPLAERTEAATTILHAPGWRFIIRGGSGPIGDSLICLPPGVHWSPVFEPTTYIWPERIPAKFDRPIMLMPWRAYQKRIEAMIPEDLRDDYIAACRWRR
jgi:hypothetical protein